MADIPEEAVELARRAYTQGIVGAHSEPMQEALQASGALFLSQGEKQLVIDAISACLDVSDYAEGPYPEWESARQKLEESL